MWTSVPDKTTGDVFLESMWDTYLRDNMNTGIQTMIGISTISVATASVTFSAIPQSFQHLVLLGYVRSDLAANNSNGFLRFNGDTGANYDYQFFVGNAATASGNETFGATSMGMSTVPANTATANVFAGFRAEIPAYANSANNKNVITKNAHKHATTTGTIFAGAWAGFWRSNAAITSLTFFVGSNIAAGSRFCLYAVA